MSKCTSYWHLLAMPLQHSGPVIDSISSAFRNERKQEKRNVWVQLLLNSNSGQDINRHAPIKRVHFYSAVRFCQPSWQLHRKIWGKHVWSWLSVAVFCFSFCLWLLHTLAPLFHLRLTLFTSVCVSWVTIRFFLSSCLSFFHYRFRF